MMSGKWQRTKLKIISVQLRVFLDVKAPLRGFGSTSSTLLPVAGRPHEGPHGYGLDSLRIVEI